MLRLAPTAVATLTAAALGLTFRPWVDGPFTPFAVAVLASVGASLLLAYWLLARSAAPWLIFAGAVAALLPITVSHTVRTLNGSRPLTVDLSGPAPMLRALTPTLHGESRLESGADSLTLHVPPDTTSFVRLRGTGVEAATRPTSFTGFPAAAPSLAPSPLTAWVTPRGLIAPTAATYGEQLEVEARVDFQNAYFVLFETDTALVQLARWGVIVTPRAPGAPLRDAAGNSAPVEGWRRWRLRRAGGQTSLSSLPDGVPSASSPSAGDVSPLWAGPDLGAFGDIRLGETRSDREHGGRLELRAVRYSRFRE
jgi:hypothetical protein